MPIRLKNSSANGSPFSKLAGSQSSPYSLAIASSNSSSVIFSRSSLLIFIASYNIFDRFRTDAALAVDLPFPALLIMWIYGSELLRGGLLFSNEKELFQFILFVHWSSCLHYTISDLTLHYFIGIPPSHTASSWLPSGLPLPHSLRQASCLSALRLSLAWIHEIWEPHGTCSSDGLAASNVIIRTSRVLHSLGFYPNKKGRSLTPAAGLPSLWKSNKKAPAYASAFILFC